MFGLEGIMQNMDALRNERDQLANENAARQLTILNQGRKIEAARDALRIVLGSDSQLTSKAHAAAKDALEVLE